MTNVANTSDKNDPAVPEFIIKDSVTVQGITEDFVWYEAKALSREMDGWDSRFQRLVSVMEARHKEHLRIIETLLNEIKTLKEKDRDRT